jgi:GNAT superfamily N-acetyltransferase
VASGSCAGRDHAFLLDPRVHPDQRHQGIGVALARAAAQAAAEAGCTVLHVDYEGTFMALQVLEAKEGRIRVIDHFTSASSHAAFFAGGLARTIGASPR